MGHLKPRPRALPPPPLPLRTPSAYPTRVLFWDYENSPLHEGESADSIAHFFRTYFSDRGGICVKFVFLRGADMPNARALADAGFVCCYVQGKEPEIVDKSIANAMYLQHEISRMDVIFSLFSHDGGFAQTVSLLGDLGRSVEVGFCENQPRSQALLRAAPLGFEVPLRLPPPRMAATTMQRERRSTVIGLCHSESSTDDEKLHSAIASSTPRARDGAVLKSIVAPLFYELLPRDLPTTE